MKKESETYIRSAKGPIVKFPSDATVKTKVPETAQYLMTSYN